MSFQRRLESSPIKNYCVYIMASERNGTLYIGVTNDLVRRVWEHANGAIKGFTQKYKVHMLVWYEMHDDIHEAIKREKNIKAWQRLWKLRLIEESNPEWKDLYQEWAGCQPALA